MKTVSNFSRALSVLHIFVVIALIISLPSPMALARPIGTTDFVPTRSGPLAPTASIVVNTTADELNTDGNCSLREAIMAANTNAAVDACTAGSGADIITLPAGTYQISIPGANENANLTGDFDITDAAGLTINGAGAGATIVDANGLDRAFHILAGPLTLNDLTVQNGNVAGTGDGGAVNFTALASLVLANTNILSSTATNGGGVAVSGRTLVIGGQFINNRSTD